MNVFSTPAPRYFQSDLPTSFSAEGGTKDFEPADLTIRCGQVKDEKSSFASLIRPSDRRGPGQDPRPQCAFEKSVLNVSCNSHQVSQLAAFFIDP